MLIVRSRESRGVRNALRFTAKVSLCCARARDAGRETRDAGRETPASSTNKESSVLIALF